MIGLVAPGPFTVGETVTVSDAATHHLRVRRAVMGNGITLYDGAGTVAEGQLTLLTTHRAVVSVTAVRQAPPPPAVHLLVPVADRDRMLWLAEKATELGLTSWRPVLWRRSRSVSPRGEGEGFAEKVRARMCAAIEQSGNPWLPTIERDVDPAQAAEQASGTRFLLTGGAPPLPTTMAAPITLALGPEGGIEDEEAALFERSGFVPVSVGAHTLRFETAGVIALGLVRALL
ncbi:MAG TPA: RsmE family RNA methyltransferase [Gemmatimonadaceae bacterium]|nr:RsmE family RNA methyltransferase [Gemmatimonadaceae bacterium]